MTALEAEAMSLPLKTWRSAAKARALGMQWFQIEIETIMLGADFAEMAGSFAQRYTKS